MSARCDQEMCPMWDGHGCPCATFGLDRDDLPTSGVFTVMAGEGDDCDHEWFVRPESDTWECEYCGTER